MNEAKEIQSFLTPLEDLNKLFDQSGYRGIIIGGVAASVLGKPRMTADLDVLVMLPVDDISRLLQNARKVGIIPRIENITEFGRENHVLLLRHQASGINIDIILGSLPLEEEIIERSQEVSIGKSIIHLPTPEDLIIMKGVAHRARDMLDIEAIVEANPAIDGERVENYLRQFSQALDMPEIWGDVARIIKMKR